MQGIVFYDPQYKFWSGTFVDSAHEGAVEECIRLAKEVAMNGDGTENPLPSDGMIVAVDFVIDKRGTDQVREIAEPLIARTGRSVVDDIAGQM